MSEWVEHHEIIICSFQASAANTRHTKDIEDAKGKTTDRQRNAKTPRHPPRSFGKKGLLWHISRSMTDDRHFFGNFPSWSVKEEEDGLSIYCCQYSCLLVQEGNPRWGGSAIFCTVVGLILVPLKRFFSSEAENNLHSTLSLAELDLKQIDQSLYRTKSHPVSFSSRSFLFVEKASTVRYCLSISRRTLING